MPKSIAYEWSQTATHLFLQLRIPYLKPRLQQKRQNEHVSVVLTSCFLRVCRPPLLLELDLWGEVSFREASISPGTETLSIVVPKSEGGSWSAVSAVSNPQLDRKAIEERRRRALAEYAKWQQDMQQQRIATLHTRREQQQKELWRRQKEQKEWYQQRKNFQAQQLLQQLEDELPTSHDSSCHVSSCGREPAESAVVFPSDDEVKSIEVSENNGSIRSNRVGAPQQTAANEGDVAETDKTETIAAVALEASTTIMGAEGASTGLVLPEPARELLTPKQEASHKQGSASLGTVAAKTSVATPFKTIKVSFAARRPNKVPARGPRQPPLPQSESVLSSSNSSRQRPGDLSRQQQSDPQWLQSKAARLLCGGDAAAAAETYTALLRQLSQQQQHLLFIAKALCGRSLAWLAMGENHKVLSDCADGLETLQKVQRQLEEAAVAAGQCTLRGQLLDEVCRLQSVLLARRAAAFLRLDTLEEAASSLEELQQLQRQHQQEAEFGESSYDTERTAVSADLHHIQRLQELRRAKEEADAVFTMAIRTSNQEQIADMFRINSKREGYVNEGKTGVGAAELSEQPAAASRLTHITIQLYAKLLLGILPDDSLRTAQGDISSASEEAPDPLSQETTGEHSATAVETENRAWQLPVSAIPVAVGAHDVTASSGIASIAGSTAAAAAKIAEKLKAAVQAAATCSTMFPLAAAAGTVLANMALALLQLQDSSCTAAAAAVASAADELLQHVEQHQWLQQVKLQVPSLQLQQHQLELEQEPHHLVDDEASMAGVVSILHKCNKELLNRLRQRVSARRALAERQQ